MWITNGTVDGKDTGDAYLVYAKTGAGRSAGDLSAFIVEKGMKGFSLGQKIEDKSGMRASMTAELVFNGDYSFLSTYLFSSILFYFHLF